MGDDASILTVNLGHRVAEKNRLPRPFPLPVNDQAEAHFCARMLERIRQPLGDVIEDRRIVAANIPQMLNQAIAALRRIRLQFQAVIDVQIGVLVEGFIRLEDDILIVDCLALRIIKPGVNQGAAIIPHHRLCGQHAAALPIPYQFCAG